MAQGFSKKIQSSGEAAYRFADFELHPQDRLLKRSGVTVRLQPKSFDALLCLVGRAERLVSKQELNKILWPDVHVSETNLTNLIVGLRKIVGRDAIHTVSKHGYRFELPVAGEPGVPQKTYEKFVRAKELTARRSIESMILARDLLWTSLAEDPGFAAAWAWLGRCCWFLDKFSTASSANPELAQAAFQRAFALDPDLACAHQFYTFTQVDTGRAGEAIRRLQSRLERHPGEPESLTGLVQAFRFRGLLDESLEAHKRAVELDPAAVTSVAHTFFLAGEYDSAIEAYGGRAAYYLDAAAWAALGHEKRAITLLRGRLTKGSLSSLMSALMRSLLALLESKTDEAVHIMDHADATRDSEILLYFARHYSRGNRTEKAIHALRWAAQAGFVCAPKTLRADPWLSPLRKQRQFALLLREFEAAVHQAQSHSNFL
jgi:DNA-binding winged helix-turn-helix (wHTH) protein/tetratricopeptide (TPR) repeat protein